MFKLKADKELHEMWNYAGEEVKRISSFVANDREDLTSEDIQRYKEMVGQVVKSLTVLHTQTLKHIAKSNGWEQSE